MNETPEHHFVLPPHLLQDRRQPLESIEETLIILVIIEHLLEYQENPYRVVLSVLRVADSKVSEADAVSLCYCAKDVQGILQGSFKNPSVSWSSKLEANSWTNEQINRDWFNMQLMAK